MKTQEFINELRKRLAMISAAEREDILRDQEEYLHEAKLAGRNEEETIAALGSPKVLAGNLSAELKINKLSSSTSLGARVGRAFSAVFAILALAPFNFFFVLWPFLLVAFADFLGWLLAGVALLVALALALTFFIKLIFVSASFYVHLSAFFFILSVLCLGLAFIFGMAVLTGFILDLTLRYLRWNFNLVKGRG